MTLKWEQIEPKVSRVSDISSEKKISQMSPFKFQKRSTVSQIKSDLPNPQKVHVIEDFNLNSPNLPKSK